MDMALTMLIADQANNLCMKLGSSDGSAKIFVRGNARSDASARLSDWNL